MPTTTMNIEYIFLLLEKCQFLVWAVQKYVQTTHVNLVDLVKSFPTDPNSNEYLLAKIGCDTAEDEPLKVCLIFT